MQEDHYSLYEEEDVCVGDYMLCEVIGEGSYGEVRQAISQKTAKRVAIKEINMARVKKAKSLEMVRNEIGIMQTLSKRSHQNVINVFEVIEGECVHIVMELIKGCSLNRLMETLEGRRMDANQMRSYFRQMLLGVAHCHAFGIIHRDIKPANLMITTTGVLKLVDFGVAERLDTYADDSQVIGMRTRGSPAFQPPEVASGKGGLGTAIDVWSAGVTLFFAITGDVPFSAMSVPALYETIINQPLEIPEWLAARDPSIVDLIASMLQKSEQERPPIDDLLHHPWVEDPAGDTLYPPQVSAVNTQSITTKLEGIYGEASSQVEQPESPVKSPVNISAQQRKVFFW